MKKFKDMGFQIDSYIMSGIVSAIRSVTTVKVEDMADTLTDRDRGSDPATFTSDEIEWMKSTPISQVTVGDNYTNNSSDFFNLLVKDEPKLIISGRSTNNGEFRGNILTVRSNLIEVRQRPRTD